MSAGGPWVCFHCGDRFVTETAARLHFGRDESYAPACQIKSSDGGLLRALREAEETAADYVDALHAESADIVKAYRANLSRHSAALIAAEEIGYERGLADGRAHNAETMLRELHEAMAVVLTFRRLSANQAQREQAQAAIDVWRLVEEHLKIEYDDTK